jgi:hypothetical protein
MEMTFPCPLLREDSIDDRIARQTILSIAASRQANSRTVHTLRQAERTLQADGKGNAERIHYFAHHANRKTAVRGAFWRNCKHKTTYEPTVYQAALVNIKHYDLDNEGTGEQFNHAGHGASRTL